MLNPVPILSQSELISAIVRQPLVVAPNTTVMEAIAYMSGIRAVCAAEKDISQFEELHIQARSSCVAIVEDGQLLGILTERDIVRLSSQQRDFANLPIRDVMTSNVVTLRAADFTDIFVAVNLLQQHHIRHLPVVDDRNCLVGLVTHESLQRTSRPVDLLRLRIVAEVMTAAVVCAAPELSMIEIARLMTVHRVSSVMIVEPKLDEQQKTIQIPIGIVTERDIVQFQALSLNLETYQVQAVMSTPIFAVKPSDSLWLVQQILEQRFIQRLAVTGDRGELLGIVTQTSLLQALNPLELYKLAEVLEAKVLKLEADKVQLLEHHTIDLEHQIEERTKKLTATVAQEQLVSKLSSQIRSSLNLTEILDTAVRELQSILCCQRISIWKFQSDARTLEVVADCQNMASTNVGQQVYDPCFAPDVYLNGKIRVIPDIYTASISACHRDLLADLKIRAKILAPILAVVDGAVPWGLISAIETDRPRDWQPQEIALIQQIATQMAIAIRQATAYEQVQSLNVDLELKVAQRTAELQESQQFLQTVIETFPLAVFWKDRESRYLGCNYNFAQDANLNLPAEIVGMTDDDLPWGAFEGAAYRADDRQVIDSGCAKLGLIEILTKADGTQIWLETNKMPLRNIDGETIGVLGTYQDITDRKHAEIKLNRLSERLSLSLKSGSVGCWEWDIMRDHLIWDDRMYELYGQTKSSDYEAYSFWLDTIHPDDRVATAALVEQSLSEKTDFDTEFRAIHPDGSIHFIKAYGLVEKVRQDSSHSMIGINFDITAAKHDELLRQQNEALICQQAERELVLREITQKIRKSLDLKTIFETSVEEIRGFMEADRVGVFKFDLDSNLDAGEFVAESVDPKFNAILGVKIHDRGFGKRLGWSYQQGKINIIQDIYKAGLLDREIQFLERFQVQANLVIPLLNGSILWGLLCIDHCTAPRSWQENEINFVTQIAEQIGIGIQQATLYEKVQLELEIRWRAEDAIAFQLRQQQTLGAIDQQIRNSLKLEEILATATLEIKDLMLVDRVTIFRLFPDGKSRVIEEVVSLNYPSLIGMNWEDEQLSQDEFEYYIQGKPRIIIDMRQDTWSKCLQQSMDLAQVKSKIVAPILLPSGEDRSHCWVNAKGNLQLWGLLIVHSCGSHRHWEDPESQLLQQIANRLAIAIKQASLFKQLEQELTERQQAEQAISLQLRHQQTLGSIAEQIRNSLNVEEILATTTTKVKELMMVDRVTIFRVFPDGKSRVVQEVVSPEYPALVDMNWEDEQFSNEGFEFYMQGKPRIVVDVMQDTWSDCLQECMSLAQVKSKIVAPILLPFGDDETHRRINTKRDVQLWGLLIVHSCVSHRHWQDAEAQLLQQIADQLAIAIQQASLFEQLQQELTERQQAEQEIALQLRQQKTLSSIAEQIRNSLKIEEILATATAQVKELMMVDRVAIFSVSTDLHLRAIEEVVSLEYPSVMMRNWEDAQLSQEEFEFYLAGNTNIVVDFQQDPWSICLQDYIEEIHVKSKIVVPILLLSGNSAANIDLDTWDEPHLWGLLSVHSCSSQRRWRDAEAKLLQQIADQLAIAIHQANLFEHLQQELTERQQAETRLVESNQELAVSNQELARATRLKDEFLANMSHELRTPLNAILGMSESLQDGVYGVINDRQNKSIGTIEKSGKHLLALINDILDLSKMEANKFKLELSDVSIQSICQNSILFVKELAMKRQIRLNIQLPEQLKYLNIRVDDLRFRQVSINLLSNAVKFTPEGGSIIFDVRIVDGVGDAQRQIAFSIIDTGIGIAPENMDKLFQSFVQIDSTLSRQYAGTGLGLSLVKRIVEMHGGKVSVQSEVNRGSCFTVSLPFFPSEEIAVEPSSPLEYPTYSTTDAEETLTIRSQTSILLVEDNEGNIETMTTYLGSRGYRLIVATNGQQAISILEDCVNGLVHSCLPDIILMDIQMPGMDGVEATTRIRQIPDYANIPIIALTALAMPTDRQRCLDAGANQYMSKPVKLSQLVASIETLLNFRQST
jgi:PAS domain S-box-containing protein